MPTREQVLALYQTSRDYDEVGRALGIWPGQAYLVATGLPADGGDSFPPDALERPGALSTSTQHLVYRDVAAENPTTKEHVHHWIKGLVARDLPMQRAAEGRDAAPGEVEEPEETDVTTVLTRDHDQVLAMMKQLKTIPGTTSGGSPVHLSRRKSLVDMVTVALSQHEAAEQETFWPVVRDVLVEGDAITDEALDQEQAGKDLLHRLSQLEPSDSQFDELVVELDTASRRHVALEDKVLLTLRLGTGEDERRQLGERFRRARQHAPTRPHPHAPKSPVVAVKAAGAAAAAMDKVRDAVGERPAERRGRATQDIERSEEAG